MKYSPIAMYVLLLLAVFVLAIANAKAGALDETRCCITPARLADGSIKRRADVLTAFKKFHPCPATGLTTGACPNWSIDHVIPLACGGVDEINNLAWMPNIIKSGKGVVPKDRWERRVYCTPQELVVMPSGQLLIMEAP